MVPVKPHWVTVGAVTQGMVGNRLSNPAAQTPSAPINCYIEPMTPKESYERWGVEYDDRFLLMCEVPDGITFLPNAEVTQADSFFGSIMFNVEGNPEPYSIGVAADHVVVYLRRFEYPDPNVS